MVFRETLLENFFFKFLDNELKVKVEFKKLECNSLRLNLSFHFNFFISKTYEHEISNNFVFNYPDIFIRKA